DTILIDRNLTAYETREEYFRMNPNLGHVRENFDKEKAVTRKWEKLVEDMLKIVIPTYHHTQIGFQCCYAKVPKQPNNDDCGICVIYLMESWTKDSILNDYNNGQLNEIKRKFVIEIARSKYNTRRIEVLQKSFAPPQRRNNPNREKKKEVKTPFIAPNTKEITKRGEGKKVAEKRKKK
ncbi:hypothetical protein PIB30_066952, partial [Stylosanthes scabra]|nr:hypothetical protein [Stylosanthes scabra]